jgi:AmiR/NasT family two-component response regulator
VTEPRIIQNFVGYTAILVSDDREAVGLLGSALEKLGLTIVEPELGGGRTIVGQDALAGDCVVFVDADYGAGIELPVSAAQQVPLVPVIGLVGIAAPSRLKSLVQLGSTATIRKPIHGGYTYAALFVGINEFRRRRALAEKVEELERRRRGRKYLVKAILRVMQMQHCDEDEAYERLRRESMGQRLGLEDFCETFVRGFPDADDAGGQEQGRKRADTAP